MVILRLELATGDKAGDASKVKGNDKGAPRFDLRGRVFLEPLLSVKIRVAYPFLNPG